MKVDSDRGPGARPAERTGELAVVRAASAWVHQLARTLKTCRLYEAGNPTVVRFRQELFESLRRLTEEHGAVVLRLAADDVVCEGASLYPARSREDNLALAFYRDGVRGLTFSPGVEPRELEALLDAVLRVTGQVESEDDLVTLLWQSHLGHIEVDYVPGEADVGGGGTGPGAAAEGEAPVPWPTPRAAATGAEAPAAGTAATAATDETTATAPDAIGAGRARSDDWSIGEVTIEIEAGLEELESIAPTELRRFQREFEAERRDSVVAAAIAACRAYLAAGAEADDQVELARFLPRVLRQAALQGSWREAREALALLQACDSPEWSREAFAQELQQPISVASVRGHLEQQSPAGVADFVALARDLGDPATDVLNLVCAEVQNLRHRRLLNEAILDLCRSNPERLAPWLADRREAVVLNVVQILGTIGGRQIVGLLQSVIQHPDPRVRLEVVSSLRHVRPEFARPLLIRLLEGADTRMFCAVLHQLSQARDPDTARLVLLHVTDPEFEKRPVEERRAIYAALSAIGGDEVLPELEAELYKGGWFARGPDPHRQAVARCIARIGTAAARTVLERGAGSRRGGVRKACEEALQRSAFRD